METTVHEIADGIYRISTAMGPEVLPGGFTFNQYLIDDDEPLLFHTGLRGIFPNVRDAFSTVLPVARLRYVGLGHFEADECGAMNQFLAAAPGAAPLCSQIAAMTSVNDFSDRPARTLGDGEELVLGRHAVRWIDTPQVPHGWDAGLLFETRTKTLLCGDLFTQLGSEHAPVVETDILGPSEEGRRGMDYFSHSPATRATLERLAATGPETLACMHGSAWRGDGAALLRALAGSLEAG